MSVQDVRVGLVVAATAVLALAAGCGGGGKDGGGAASSGTTGAAAAADSCVAGAVKDTDAGFCIAPPPGTKPSPPDTADPKNPTYWFLDGKGAGVRVIVSKLDAQLTWDFFVKGYDASAGNPDRSQQESGDLPGGGKFWSYTQGTMRRVDVITHKGDKLFTCNTVGENPDQPTRDSCKSLRVL